MKRLLLVFAGLVVGMAHAQTVDWNKAYLTSCSSEVREFEADGRSSWQRNRDFEVSRYLSPPLTEAKLRERLRDFQGHVAAGYNGTDTQMNICVVNAALKQLQSGSTQSSAAMPSRPPQGNASAGSSGRDRADLAAHHCVSRADNRLRNNCSQTIKVNWCTDDGGTFSSCGTKNMPFSIFNPGDSIYVSAPKAYWFACATPARPSEVEYLPGQGLRGACSE